jgi:hypothetical protein
LASSDLPSSNNHQARSSIAIRSRCIVLRRSELKAWRCASMRRRSASSRSANLVCSISCYFFVTVIAFMSALRKFSATHRFYWRHPNLNASCHC